MAKIELKTLLTADNFSVVVIAEKRKYTVDPIRCIQITFSSYWIVLVPGNT